MNGLSRLTNKKISKLVDRIRYKLDFSIFNQLRTRLLLVLTFLSTIPLVVVGLFMISVMEDSLTDHIKNQHSEIVRRASNEIRLFLETPITILETLPESKDIIEMNPFAQNLILNKVVARHPIFNRIFTIDPAGNEITTTTFSVDLKNYIKKDFFGSAIRGEKFFSTVQFNEAKEPYVISSHPIRQFNKIVGVLAGEIDLMSIWELVDGITLGETGNVFVIGSKGQLIAHVDKKKVLDNAKVIDLELLKPNTLNRPSTIQFMSPEGNLMLGTYSRLRDMDWTVVIQQSEEEAFDLVNRMRFQVFAFVGLVLALAILLAVLLEKRITGPITTLVYGVNRYAEGELDFKIKIHRFDEIAVLADEFNAMAEKLAENQRKLRHAERLAAMSRFAALISHEIRNPLNSMNINMQILRRQIEKGTGSKQEKIKYMEIISSEIVRMDNLINNFLMISRPPRFDFIFEDIHQILDEVVFMHAGMAEQQSVKIERNYCTDKILTKVDKDQMKQVFHNIVINAVQALAQGGKLVISTICKMEGAQAQKSFKIEFMDNGPGIPENLLKEIFDFYFSSKKSGSGIGLAIARQIVEAHEGHIYAENNPAGGIKMTVELPMVPSDRIKPVQNNKNKS